MKWVDYLNEAEVAYGWWICSPDGWYLLSCQIKLETKLKRDFDSRWDMGVSEQCWAVTEGLAEVPKK